MVRVPAAGVAAIISVVVSITLAACGGGASHSSSDTAVGKQVVAEVAGTPIVRAQVNHWMTSLAGLDYYVVSLKNTIPPGLVSDPPDYEHCLEQLENAINRVRGRLTETKAQLMHRCRQLNEALKLQATSHLVSALRTIALARAIGISPSDVEVQKRYAGATASEYPTQADYRHYLENTHGSSSDGLLEAKIGLIGDRTLEKVKSPTVRARYLKTAQQWRSKITCSPGYVVEYCKQYKGATYPSGPPASVQMEQLAALITGHCVNLEACAKLESEK